MKSSDANINFPSDGSKHATFTEVDPSRPVKYYNIHDVIKELDRHQTITLLGEAGSGKTYTGCHYMAEQYMKNRSVLFTTQSHKCLRNDISEFYSALDDYGVEKKPPKKKIGATFAKLSGTGGKSFIDSIKKDTIIYADECGFLDKSSLSALITLVKRGHHVIFAGDIKQDSKEDYYTILVASSTNYLELLGSTNDKYYDESLIYNAFGGYYDEFWRLLLSGLKEENLPYAIRLETGPHPLHTRFDTGYVSSCIDKFPYYLDRINLFIARDLRNKYARKLQEKRRKLMENSGIDTKKLQKIWANSKNEDDGNDETHGPIFTNQNFRICENSRSKKPEYTSGDILKFLHLDEKGNAVCTNTETRKEITLPRSSFVNIKAADCYTLAEYQGNRTKRQILVIARRGSLNATRIFTLNTRAESGIEYVITTKKDGVDTPLDVDTASKYVWSLHDRPMLKDKFGSHAASIIKSKFHNELGSLADKIQGRKLSEDEIVNFAHGTNIGALRCLKERKEKDNKRKKKVSINIADTTQPEMLPIGEVVSDSALIGLKKIFSRNKILKDCLPSDVSVDRKNAQSRRAHTTYSCISTGRLFTSSRLASLCQLILHNQYSIRSLIEYIEERPELHKRLSCWRSIIAECIVNELDKRKKDKENSASKVFGEFLSLKYTNTPNGRWNKLPYLASVCVNRKDLLCTLFDVDDIADYVENKILSKFDDPTFATSFRTCINYFKETPESRPETIRRKLVKNSNDRNEITLEKTSEDSSNSASTIAKTHLRLKDSGEKFFFSSGTNLDTGKTYPINYGVSKKKNATSEFRQSKTIQEVLRQNVFYTKNSEKHSYSHALNLKDSHLLVIDNVGDENVTKMIEDRSKELGIDVLREVCPTNPHKAHYFFSCNFSSNDDISCAFIHNDKSKYKADVFLPTANHLIYRKDKVSMGKDLPDAHDFSDIIKVIILSRK